MVYLMAGALFLSSCSLQIPSKSSSIPSLAASSAASMAASDVSSASNVSSASSSVAVSSTVSIAGNPVKDVKDYLAGLPAAEIASGKKAIEFINASASNVAEANDKDILLGLYLSFAYKLAFTLMDVQFESLNKMWIASQASFNVTIAENGLRALEVEGSFVLVPDFNVIITSMNNILTDHGKVYCGLMVSMHNLEPIASESGVLIPIASLNKLQADWAGFVTKIAPKPAEFPPSDSTYKGHFEAHRVSTRLNNY